MVERLDEVMIEAGLLRPAAVFVLAVSCYRHDDGVFAALLAAGAGKRPRSRPCQGGRCRAGRIPAGTAARPRVPRGRREPSPRRARSASRASTSRGPCRRCHRRPGFGHVRLVFPRRVPPRASSCVSGRFAAGSRIVNSLPLPGPSLLAATLPPCISTSFFTTVSPMPSPPSEPRERAVPLDE